MLPDAHLDDPLLNDAFDFSRYPIFKTRNTKLPTSHELRHRGRGRVTLFTYSSRGSPPGAQRSRNVSEPQLISSTNYMRESWFTNFASARTVGDIANLFNNDDVFPAIHCSQTIADTHESLGDGSSCDVNDNQPHETPPTTMCEGSSDISGKAEPSEYKEDGGSLYSMDSADQDAHPLLLSMPIIPEIKLERKATIRKPDLVPSSDASRNQTFLSPRIRDLRTPPRMSSRRYGHIPPRTSPSLVNSDAIPPMGHGGARSFETYQRYRADLACTCSASEPMLYSAYPSDDEKEPLLKKAVIDSPHSEVLLSMIDEVCSSSITHGDLSRSEVDEPPKPKQASVKHSKRGHQRPSVSRSISFSGIVHAVADGCASLDILLRDKPKIKLRSRTKPKPHERIPNAHDPMSKWAPEQRQIFIKVFVPSTDDIWMFRVSQDINLADFTSMVVSKLGFSVSFSGSLWDEPKYYFRTDERFQSWVKRRIRFGRNLPIVAHVAVPLPLVRLSVDEDGCEVWCVA